MKKITCNKKGLTLIEILISVVLAILVMMCGLSLFIAAWRFEARSLAFSRALNVLPLVIEVLRSDFTNKTILWIHGKNKKIKIQGYNESANKYGEINTNGNDNEIVLGSGVKLDLTEVDIDKGIPEVTDRDANIKLENLYRYKFFVKLSNPDENLALVVYKNRKLFSKYETKN